ncbi:MAG TPA: 2Fe-2S iron-sulfur cluster binding domain-containing protein, partial [Leptospiraceae bacterium]|nr:2Fe-2S iron-sulfur cluster binding domain-containing protein [Leptospiraceae bacterium]
KSSAKRHLKDVSVTLTKSHRTILVKGEKNLLEELEDNGIYPQSGCRMGICHTCACTKKTGTVTNLQEGTVSENKDETIQLCLSRAEENLELDL